MNHNTAPLSNIKGHALKVLDCFDELAKPEIKNRVMQSVWNYIKKYTRRIIERKPDNELKEKLFEVYKTLGPLFTQTDLSVQIQEGEALGSPKIPNVGELAQIKNLTSCNELLKELKL